MKPQIMNCNWDNQVQGVVVELRMALSKYFRRPTKVAVITQLIDFDLCGLQDNDQSPEDLWLFDPDSLLKTHNEKLVSYFKQFPFWKRCSQVDELGKDCEFQAPEITDCVCFAKCFATHVDRGYAIAIFVETENSKGVKPLIEWLKFSCDVLGNEIAMDEYYRSAFVPMIREGAPKSVASSIASEYVVMDDTDANAIVIQKFISSLLEISKTTEERKHADGTIAVVSACKNLPFEIVFSGELPSMSNAKRVGKIMGALPSNAYALVVDSSLEIQGIAKAYGTEHLVAKFDAGKARVAVKGKEFCVISDGNCYATDMKSSSRELQRQIEAMQKSPTCSDQLSKIVEQIQRTAIDGQYGCLIVLDFNEEPQNLSGQLLANPIDLTLSMNVQIASSMSSIDGAIHVDHNCLLRGFGCLMDGEKVDDEKLDRGARYNSALRFARQNSNVLVVVVSEDGHQTIFNQDGETKSGSDLKSLDYVCKSERLKISD